MDKYFTRVQEFYDRNNHFLFNCGYEHVNRYALAPFFRKWLKNRGQLLDVGAGSGHLAKQLGIENAIFMDLARKQIQRFKDSGVPGFFIQGDLLHLPFDNDSFDEVICSNVLHYTGLGGMKELIRVTKPGGQLLVSFLEGSEFTQTFTRMAVIWELFPPLMRQAPFICLAELTKLNIRMMDKATVVSIPPVALAYRNMPLKGLVAFVFIKVEGEIFK